MTQNVTVMEYTYNINSYQRSSGTNTSFNINFSETINLLARKGQFQIIFQSVQIPFTFYQLSNIDSLNVLSVTIQSATGGWTQNVTLNQGNYTPYTLVTELSRVLTLACQVPPSAYSAQAFTPVFSFSYTPSSGFMSFAQTGPAGTATQLNFATSPNKLTAGFFGINTTTPTNVVMSQIGSVIGTSTQPCVLNPVNYLLVRSSLKQYRNREFIVLKDDVSDIVYKVPILTSQGTWLNFFQASEPIYLVDNSIQTINFYLTNNLSYTPINLQQIPWSFSFTIREVLRPDYEARNSFLKLVPALADTSQEEIDRLVKEKELNLQKLVLYKKKLNLEGQ